MGQNYLRGRYLVAARPPNSRLARPAALANRPWDANLADQLGGPGGMTIGHFPCLPWRAEVTHQFARCAILVEDRPVRRGKTDEVGSGLQDRGQAVAHLFGPASLRDVGNDTNVAKQPLVLSDYRRGLYLEPALGAVRAEKADGGGVRLAGPCCGIPVRQNLRPFLGIELVDPPVALEFFRIQAGQCL